MTHRILAYSEKTIIDLGVNTGISYTVEGQTRNDDLSQVGLEIQYKVGETMKTFPLGLNADTQGFKPGDTLEFQTEINPLRLSKSQITELGVEIGQKFVVKADKDKTAGPKSGPYIEINTNKVFLFNLRSNFAPHIDETREGEILTITEYWGK